MKLLITGALGHIGSRLIHSLRPGDFEKVVLLDNFSTQRYCSLFDLPQEVPFRFVEGDICVDDLNPLFEDIDVVVHLAAITNAVASLDAEELVERVNLTGTERVATACANHGCRLLFLSTTSVYGSQEAAVDEQCAVEDLRPQSPYASSKLRAERLLGSLGANGDLQFFIGRFGTIYDTSIGMRFHTAINRFCWQASVGQPLTVWRTAMDQNRPYLDLDDGVRAIAHVIRRGLFDNRVYNVVSQNVTVRQIVDFIREEVPDLQVTYVDSPIMNQLSYSVEAERIRQQGFEFHGDLKLGINRTLTLLRGLRQGRPRIGPGAGDE